MPQESIRAFNDHFMPPIVLNPSAHFKIFMKLTGHKTDKVFTRDGHLDKEEGEGAMAKLDNLVSTVRNK
ncbi:MAG: hypothetical protein L6301_15550 [Desulfobacteraceae bacterium]|nr:hypothetical protein [Desulfobacteraceae bacterium]